MMFNGLTDTPSFLNSEFYPSIKCITNHIYKITYQLKLSKLDQVHLDKKIKEWSQEDSNRKFFLRIFQNKEDANYKDQLLYIHQEKWQRDLLLKYGGEICLLDATYKTTKYALPLFFLCVKTNSGYAVVGNKIIIIVIYLIGLIQSQEQCKHTK